MKPTEMLEAKMDGHFRGLLRTEHRLDQALGRLLAVPWWNLRAHARAVRALRRAHTDRAAATADLLYYLDSLHGQPLCGRCRGTGIDNAGTCPHCHGTGRYHVDGFPVLLHPDAPPGFLGIRDTGDRTRLEIERDLARISRHNVDTPPVYNPPTKPEERL